MPPGVALSSFLEEVKGSIPLAERGRVCWVRRGGGEGGGCGGVYHPPLKEGGGVGCAATGVPITLPKGGGMGMGDCLLRRMSKPLVKERRKKNMSVSNGNRRERVSIGRH